MAKTKIHVYRTYRFIDKDPIIDKARTVLQDEGLYKRLGVVSELSGVSHGTLSNWFNGHTRKPQFATLAAVATSVGYDLGFMKQRSIAETDESLERELAKARAWKAKQPKRRASKRKNGKA